MVLIILYTLAVVYQLEFLTCRTRKMHNHRADFGHTTNKASFSGTLSFVMKTSGYVGLNAASPYISFNKRKPKMSIQCSVRPFKVSGWENTLCESLFTYDLLPRFESFLVFWSLLKIILSVEAAVNSCERLHS